MYYFPLLSGPSNLALKNMLMHTQSLRSLTLRILPRINAMAAAWSGLKKNTTLRELTLVVSPGATTTTISPIFTSVRDHPLLQRVCVCGCVVDLTGLETVLLSDTSKITELEIHSLYGRLPLIGLARVFQALGRRPTLTKLRLNGCRLCRDDAKEIRRILCNTPSLQTLGLRSSDIGSAGLFELAPALHRNTSIKVLDLSYNEMGGMQSARLLLDILRCNKTITAVDLSGNMFVRTTGALECIAAGLGSNSTLLTIGLSRCALLDGGLSILMQTPSTTQQKLTLDNNGITSTGFRVLLQTMEQSSHDITDLDLQTNSIGNGGAIFLTRTLEDNTLPNLRRLSLYNCDIDDDGFITLVSALEQNTSLLHLDLRHSSGFSERAFFTLAESLAKIKVLQRVDFNRCTCLASAMPAR